MHEGQLCSNNNGLDVSLFGLFWGMRYILFLEGIIWGLIPKSWLVLGFSPILPDLLSNSEIGSYELFPHHLECKIKFFGPI